MKNSLEEFQSKFKLEERISESKDRPIDIQFEEQRK